VITVSGAALIVAAGMLAGIVGTAGGITSLVSYPALLVAGVPALAANVVNIVALVACWPGSAVASRPELQGRASWLGRWALVAAAGGAVGAGLLLLTPSAAFGDVVPFLIVAGSLILVAQPKLSAYRDGSARNDTLILMAGLLAVSVYSGYFGAGSGVMTLALLLITVDQHVARANALKNMLVGAATVVSAVTLIILVPVDWGAVIPLAAGFLVGSMIGPRVARRLPASALRWFAALLGIGLAVKLWVDPA
jgi:uncharacterized membrane protein YfcA